MCKYCENLNNGRGAGNAGEMDRKVWPEGQGTYEGDGIMITEELSEGRGFESRRGTRH